MPKVFIDGEAGTTGLGIRRRLGALPQIELISLDDAARKEPSARLDAMRQSALTVLCLPDEAARQAVGLATSLGADAPKILDASSAHRVADGWVFGFPELASRQPELIAAADRVANPGCYATGAIALLRPLIESGILSPEQDITINAVSGYSGGGKAMIAAHEASGGPAFELYGLTLMHKHVPEIMRHAGLARRPIFVPSVGHFRQGMLVCIPVFLDRLHGAPAAYELAELYRETYENTRRIFPKPGLHVENLQPEALNDSDVLEIFVCAHDVEAVLVARLDNLGKGAAGAAVQNIALMLGLADPLFTEEDAINA